MLVEKYWLCGGLLAYLFDYVCLQEDFLPAPTRREEKLKYVMWPTSYVGLPLLDIVRQGACATV